MTTTHLLAFRPVGWLAPRIRDGAVRAAALLSRRIHAIRPEHLLWTILAAVLVLYLLTLVLEPSAAGRGGR